MSSPTDPDFWSYLSLVVLAGSAIYLIWGPRSQRFAVPMVLTACLATAAGVGAAVIDHDPPFEVLMRAGMFGFVMFAAGCILTRRRTPVTTGAEKVF